MGPAGWQLSVATDWVPDSSARAGGMRSLREARQLAARELADAVAFGAPRRHGLRCR